MKIVAVPVVLVLVACASVDERLQSPSPQVRECVQWFDALDEEIDAAGVRDAQYVRLPAFPYLRVDRLLASLRDHAARSEAALHAYAERLLELDLESRRHEIANLPHATPGAALRRTRECGRLLREIDLAKPQARAALIAQARVPDSYSDASRLIGLYPVTRLAFASGIRRWQEETLARFRGEPSLPPGATRVRYAPPAGPPTPRGAVAGILGRAQFDPLGFASLSERELERLAAAYAPSFEIAIAGDYDRFGLLRWRRDAALPEVDAAEPAVFVHHGYTRYGERLLLQIAYTVWFPERPAMADVDLLAGRLDGIVWRVTLAPDGEPLIYDAIHPCGCYHEFFPTPRAQPRAAPDPVEEWAFVPQTLPRLGEEERPLVRIASGTHYIERVGVVRGADSVVRYAFYPYDVLRSLPTFAGATRSAFGPDGLIAGSERAEQWLFWPMGIASAGAMRQWGHHATAFVGRRHFDDPDLIERRFALDLGEPPQ